MTNTTAEPKSPPSEALDPFRYGWRCVWQKQADGQVVCVEVPLSRMDVLFPQEEDRILHNSAHDRDCTYLKGALILAMNGTPHVEVHHDVRIDFGVEGVKPLGPDLSVFVEVTGEWNRLVGTFKVAEVGARPLLVLEVTSPSTREVDLAEKVVLYHRARVPFYAILDHRQYDGTSDITLIGYRWMPEGYLRVPLDDQGRLWLEPVKMWLGVTEDRAVAYDQHGVRVPDIAEAVREGRKAEARSEELQTLTEEAILARQEAERRADQEARERQQAEQRAETEARERQQAEQRAETEARERQLAQQRAETEARERQLAQQRAADLEKRLAALEDQMRQLRAAE